MLNTVKVHRQSDLLIPPQNLLALCLALQRNVETFLPCNAQYLVALPLEMPYLLYQIFLKPFQFQFKPR